MEKWYAEYRYRFGSVRASRNIEPTKKSPQYYSEGFDSKEEAEEYYRDRLQEHVSDIIYTIKSLSTNKALRNRLKKYKATEANEALKAVEQILKTIPDFKNEK